MHASRACVAPFFCCLQILATVLRGLCKVIAESKDLHLPVGAELLRHLRALLVFGVDVAAVARAAASSAMSTTRGSGGAAAGWVGSASVSRDGSSDCAPPGFGAPLGSPTGIGPGSILDSDTSDNDSTASGATRRWDGSSCCVVALAGRACSLVVVIVVVVVVVCVCVCVRVWHASRHPAVRARVAVLSTLQTIARSSPKLVQAQWSLFLPIDGATGFDPRRPTLLAVMLHDPAARVREGAAAALGALMDGAPLEKLLPLNIARAHGSPGRGKTAPRRPSSMAVTTMSDRVALMVRCVHAALRRAMEPGVEPVASVLTQVLKTLTAVINVTPYTRLGDNTVLPSFLVPLRRMLWSRGAHRGGFAGMVAWHGSSPLVRKPGCVRLHLSEQSIAVATAVAIGAAGQCVRVPQLAHALRHATPPPNSTGAGGAANVAASPRSGSARGRPDRSLLQQLLHLAETSRMLPVRLAALNVVSKMVKNYAQELRCVAAWLLGDE